MSARLSAWSQVILLSEGASRWLIAFLAGAVGALAMAPVGLVPAFAISFPVAVWLLDGATGGPSRFSPRALLAAARDGWWFGFGYFLAGLWWIGAAFLVETDEFAWALPLGVVGLPAGLALFMAAGFALARLVWLPGAARILSLTAGLGLSEAARHMVLTGFPWNGFGQGLGFWLVPAQIVSVIGTDGLGLLTIAIFAAPATLVDETPDGRANIRPLVLAALGLVVIFGFGAARLMLSGGVLAQPQRIETVPNVRLRLVQPNMSQREKIAQQDGLAVLRRLIAQSDRATGPKSTGMVDATHVIWPESPFPFLLTNEPSAMAELARVQPPSTTVLTGAVRAEPGPDRSRIYYNSLVALGAKATILATYDKVHLVPFGEYLPLESVLSALGLRRFVHAPGSFSLGGQRQPMELPGLPPLLPLICYEAIFPYEIDAATKRPEWMLNITNDAWFGETFGPHQHFAQARLRAIELGLPLVRVANTGISGLVDGHGRTLAASPVGAESIIDVLLPKALPTTVYATVGNNIGLFGPILSLVLGGFVATLDRRRGRNRTTWTTRQR
ncbi:MAG TPA: apolipoprotein N-acyltransferase [Beijerinckiaceae bacterium]|nr:apolipoprotein N-acyltransferase [Beijerinckiaceae bacterium]